MEPVIVDVGGVVFKSTFETLGRSPKLASLASSPVFIDRDGAPFAAILTYLRTGELDVPA